MIVKIEDNFFLSFIVGSIDLLAYSLKTHQHITKAISTINPLIQPNISCDL
jgi:hypothetical protein